MLLRVVMFRAVPYDNLSKSWELFMFCCSITTH